MGRSSSRVLLPALVVLALVAIVAIAATGSLPGSTSDTRRPPDVLFDTVFSLLAVALIPAAVILVWGLAQRREVSAEYQKVRRRNQALIFLLLLLPVAVYFYRPTHPPDQESGLAHAQPVAPGTTPPNPGGTQYEPRFAWLPVTVILTLLGAAVLAWYLSSRRKRTARERDEQVTETLASVLDDTLDDLRAEADPRRAVIAAYARLERALATQGLARRPAETPEELLGRVLGRLDVSGESIRRLTDLFERAKFSQHEVDDGMKEEAIAALQQVRDELRAAEAARRAEETPELPQLAEDRS
ncbi:MAG TPA: DUF4129 domain-containing protein [Gaiellaceae bacterium]|nr:DUF4129 domain-containing protein [Gaiellaceae bacterium]